MLDICFLVRFHRVLPLLKPRIAQGSLLAALEKGQEWQRALGELSKSIWCTVGCNSCLSACEKAAEWRLALQLLEPLRSLRMADVITFNAILSACEKGNSWSYALYLLEEMEDLEVTPDVISYSAVVSAAEKGSLLEASSNEFEGDFRLD